MTTSTLVVQERTRKRLAFRENLGRWDVKFSPYLFISPFFILFALVGLFPLLTTGWVAVHQWALIGGQGSVLRVEHLAVVLQQRQFWVALHNPLTIFLVSAVPQLIFAIVIAAVL